MNSRPHVPKQRPYWHVDLKWMFGIAGFFTLAAALLFGSFTFLTERERAVTISTNFVASSFSRDGLDSEAGVAEFRQAALALPGGRVAPIEQFPWLTLSREDVATLSPRDLRMKIFRQITEPIYDKGLSGAAAQFTDNPDDQKMFEQQAIALSVLTKSTHESFRQAAVVSAIVAVIMLAGTIFFSTGWGRLVSPAVIALLVSPPGLLVGLALKYPPKGGTALTPLPGDIAPQIGQSLLATYGLVSWVGISLLLVAGVGALISRSRRKRSLAESDQTPKT